MFLVYFLLFHANMRFHSKQLPSLSVTFGTYKDTFGRTDQHPAFAMGCRTWGVAMGIEPEACCQPDSLAIPEMLLRDEQSDFLCAS